MEERRAVLAQGVGMVAQLVDPVGDAAKVGKPEGRLDGEVDMLVGPEARHLVILPLAGRLVPCMRACLLADVKEDDNVEDALDEI